MILQSILAVDTITARASSSSAPTDKVAKVCCALCNLCSSIVPFD